MYSSPETLAYLLCQRLWSTIRRSTNVYIAV